MICCRAGGNSLHVSWYFFQYAVQVVLHVYDEASFIGEVESHPQVIVYFPSSDSHLTNLSIFLLQRCNDVINH